MITVEEISDSVLARDEASKERWRRIAGFEGYEVSSYGRVRSYKGDSPEPYFLSIFIKDGRPCVSFYQDDDSYTFRLARVVANAFLPGAKGRRIYYRNGNPMNCALSNLHGKWSKGVIQGE